MGRGASGINSGSSAGGGNQAQAGFAIDTNATKALNDAIAQMQPNILGNFLMTEKKKVGKIADKAMNVYRKFDKGWWTQVFSDGYNDGSFDVGDIGGSVAAFKNIAKFTIQSKQG